MRAFGVAVAALCALAAGSAMAQGVVRIGVMNDMSGVTSGARSGEVIVCA